MAEAVDQLGKTIPGKRALAIEAFSRALRRLPTIIADNAGYDSAELISQLRAEINNGSVNAGIDISNGSIGDMDELGVKECLRVKE